MGYDRIAGSHISPGKPARESRMLFCDSITNRLVQRSNSFFHSENAFFFVCDERAGEVGSLREKRPDRQKELQLIDNKKRVAPIFLHKY